MTHNILTSQVEFILTPFYLSLTFLMLYKVAKGLSIFIMIVDTNQSKSVHSKILIFLLAVGWCTIIGVIASNREIESFLKWFAGALTPVLLGVIIGLRNTRRIINNQPAQVNKSFSQMVYSYPKRKSTY